MLVAFFGRRVMSGVSSNVNTGSGQGFVGCCCQLTMSIMRDEPQNDSNQEPGHTYLWVQRNIVNVFFFFLMEQVLTTMRMVRALFALGIPATDVLLN